jgi:hypothetical protein
LANSAVELSRRAYRTHNKQGTGSGTKTGRKVNFGIEGLEGGRRVKGFCRQPLANSAVELSMRACRTQGQGVWYTLRFE